MGASLVYLDKPNKEIEYDEGEDDKMIFAAGSMQGWRLNMEDSHIANLQFEKSKNHSLFGVFDGHGG
jgi:serine/threonine protein phosphatase PrpC